MKQIFITTVDPTIGSGQNAFALNLLKVAYHSNCFDEYWLFKAADSEQISFLGDDVTIFTTSERFKLLYILSYQFFLICKFMVSKNNKFVFSLKPYFFSALFLRYRGHEYSVITEGYMKKNICNSYNRFMIFIYLFVVNSIIKRAVKVSSCYTTGVEWVNSLRPLKDCVKIHCGVTDDLLPRINTLGGVSKKGLKYDVGYVGSFRDIHKLDLLMKVAKAANYSVQLVGYGKELSTVKQLVRELNMCDQVNFAGYIRNQDVPHYTSECCVMWGFSADNYWGLPMKIIEYLSVGRPVVANFKADLMEFYDIGAIRFFSEKASTDEIVQHIEYLRNFEKVNEIKPIIDQGFRWTLFEFMFDWG